MIYAELFFNEKKNEFLNHLPSGVFLKRKGDSRSCIFECEDDLDRQALVELLTQNMVCFQDTDEKSEREIKKEEKERKKIEKRKRFG